MRSRRWKKATGLASRTDASRHTAANDPVALKTAPILHKTPCHTHASSLQIRHEIRSGGISRLLAVDGALPA